VHLAVLAFAGVDVDSARQFIAFAFELLVVIDTESEVLAVRSGCTLGQSVNLEDGVRILLVVFPSDNSGRVLDLQRRELGFNLVVVVGFDAVGFLVVLVFVFFLA